MRRYPCFGNRLHKYLFRYNMPEILRRDATYPKIHGTSYGAPEKRQAPGIWRGERKYYPLGPTMSSGFGL